MPELKLAGFAVAFRVAGVVPVILSNENHVEHPVSKVAVKLAPPGVLAMLMFCVGGADPPKAKLNGRTDGVTDS